MTGSGETGFSKNAKYSGPQGTGELDLKVQRDPVLSGMQGLSLSVPIKRAFIIFHE